MAEQKNLSQENFPSDPVRNHRVQVFWQIWLPISLVMILAVGLFMLALLSTESNTLELENVQATAFVVLIAPLLFVGIALFILLILTIYGTSKLFALAPIIRNLSIKVDALSKGIIRWSNRITLPFLAIEKFRTGIKKKKSMTSSE